MASSSKLVEIVKHQREELITRKNAISEKALLDKMIELEEVKGYGKPISLEKHLRRCREEYPSRMVVAAEFKRASASKGDMDSGLVLGVEGQVKVYVEAGASIVSILTEGKWFKGSLEDMLIARQVINEMCMMTNNKQNRPLILRKDFIVDEYQLLEARAYGADTVLLMLSILDNDTFSRLLKRSRELGMEPLVEVANEKEMLDALALDAKVIGVNNRDLHTFTVDMTTTTRMVAVGRREGKIIDGDLASSVLILALSGVKTRQDVVEYEKFGGVTGILVGETLMRSKNPHEELRGLIMDLDSQDSNLASLSKAKPLVKICGITRVQDALVAAESGAHFVGMIFAKSKRTVSLSTAREIVNALRRFRETPGKVISIPDPTSFHQSDLKKQKTESITSPVSHEASEWFSAWAPSIRLTCRGRGRPLAVGVFMDQTAEEINKIAEETGIDLIQLHGKEGFQFASKLIRPVIRVVHINHSKEQEEEDLSAKVAQYIEPGPPIAILLDTSVKGSSEGGSGVTFDWNVAKVLHEKHGIPVMIAGGLTPENVRDVLPFSSLGVDVSSGVESESTPGIKLPEKIRSFVTQALA